MARYRRSGVNLNVPHMYVEDDIVVNFVAPLSDKRDMVVELAAAVLTYNDSETYTLTDMKGTAAIVVRNSGGHAEIDVYSLDGSNERADYLKAVRTSQDRSEVYQIYDVSKGVCERWVGSLEVS